MTILTLNPNADSRSRHFFFYIAITGGRRIDQKSNSSVFYHVPSVLYPFLQRLWPPLGQHTDLVLDSPRGSIHFVALWLYSFG